jgi:hypothetical protein
MVTRVRDTDRGYKDMRKRLALMRGSYTKVGIQVGSRTNDGITDLALVAAANEFGTETIPERSFMRSTFEEEREKLTAISYAEAQAILAGRKDVETSLDLMGLYLVGRIQAKIHSHPAPENAPATIARKNSCGTLIDSGQLVQSIRHVNTIKGRR